MKIGSLFAGIGGFELAATWAGFTPEWSNEIDSYCCKVLRKNFTHQVIEADIRTIGKDRKHELQPVDIICGGFPCQPFSTAGKRRGTDDDRYLWPEMLRIIEEVRPAWIIGENVAGILSMDGGRILRKIRSDLDAEGYWSEVFGLPAIGVGASHQRQRIWIVGYTESIRRKLGASENEWTASRKEHTFGNQVALHSSYTSIKYDGRHTRKPEAGQKQEPGKCFVGGVTTDSGATRLSRRKQHRAFDKGQQEQEPFGPATEPDSFTWSTHWYEVATRLCRVDDGVPSWVDRHRTNRLKALGNAIVPQVAYEIFRAISLTK